MFISRHTLLGAIKQVAPAVKKSNLPCLECVRIEIVGKSMRTDATHLDLGLSFRAELGTAFTPTEFLILVPLHPFFDILSALEGDDVELDVNLEKWRMTVKAGPAKSVLPLIDPTEFPPMPNFPEGGLGIEPKQFKKAVMAASADIARPVKQCAHFETKDGVMTVEATDGFRVSRLKTQYGGAAFNALIPAVGIDQIVSWGTVTFHKTENNLVLITNGFNMLTSAQVEGRFPPIDQILPKTKNGSLQVNSLALATALKQAQFIAKSGEGNMVVRLKTTEAGLTLFSHVEDKEFETEIPSENQGAIEFAMNVSMFLEGVQVIGGPVVIEWLDCKSPITIKAAGNPDWVYIQMPMHLSK